MQKTVFKIQKMDCPAEESLIRLKLNDVNSIISLGFDLQNRSLTVHHSGNYKQIEKTIAELNLDSKIISSEDVEQISFTEQSDQRKILWVVLIINFAFFMIEMTAGLISGSMGLVADSLDMLADAFVYGISLYAVGGAVSRKKNIAKLAGYFQITLAVIGFVEVLRRFLGVEEVPDFITMVAVSFFALIANGICLYLLQKSKSKEAHMRASMIFTSNDVIINIGVIVAGILVLILKSIIPDLVIGGMVFVLVVIGAIRILNLSK